MLGMARGHRYAGVTHMQSSNLKQELKLQLMPQNCTTSLQSYACLLRTNTRTGELSQNEPIQPG
jgi:hypothetical protein